jgi:hypothetical protein
MMGLQFASGGHVPLIPEVHIFELINLTMGSMGKYEHKGTREKKYEKRERKKSEPDPNEEFAEVPRKPTDLSPS